MSEASERPREEPREAADAASQERGVSGGEAREESREGDATGVASAASAASAATSAAAASNGGIQEIAADPAATSAPATSAPATTPPATEEAGQPSARMVKARRLGLAFQLMCQLAAWFGVLVLAVLLAGTFFESIGWLDGQFLTSRPTGNPKTAGALPGIWGTFWLILLTGLFAVPVGVGAAVYLEEFAGDSWLRKLVQVNLANLAGVPSVVYGILGLSVFVRMFGLYTMNDPQTLVFPSDGLATIAIPLTDLQIKLWQLRVPLPLGRSILAGALTMGLLILPVIIVAAQEALRAVPPSIRHASLALGATRWQTIRRQVLPAATPGIMTGIILAISRAIGETAPLIMIGSANYIARSPGGIESVSDLVTSPERLTDVPFDSFTTLTLLIYGWIDEAKPDFVHVTAAGVIVLLVVLLLLNALAVLIRSRFSKGLAW